MVDDAQCHTPWSCCLSRRNIKVTPPDSKATQTGAGCCDSDAALEPPRAFDCLPHLGPLFPHSCRIISHLPATALRWQSEKRCWWILSQISACLKKNPYKIAAYIMLISPKQRSSSLQPGMLWTSAVRQVFAVFITTGENETRNMLFLNYRICSTLPSLWSIFGIKKKQPKKLSIT